MGEVVGERRLTLRREQTLALAGLLAWDAPFLPQVVGVQRVGERVEVACRAVGLPLLAVRGWPRGLRAAVTLQLVACTNFLMERGFLPLRGLLRQARVAREPAGPWLRLLAPPLLRAGDVAGSLRLQRVVRWEEALVGRTLAPLVAVLLPERAARLQEVWRRCTPAEAGAAAVEELLAENRGGALLAHPAGAGRALWARQFAVPESGVVWVEGEEAPPRVLAAAQLAACARGRPLRAAGGALDEEDVAAQEAAAVAAGADCLVVTTVPLEVARVLHLEEGEPVWVLAPAAAHAHAHVKAVLELGRDQAALAGRILEAAAGEAFAQPPRAPQSDRASLASPAARRTLTWLAAAPAGLTADDLAALGVGGDEVLAELRRLGLAYLHDGVWRAVTLHQADEARLTRLARELPTTSPRRLLAQALAGGDAAPLAGWAAARLEEGRAREVYQVVRVAPPHGGMAELAAEAALQMGRLGEARAHLEAVAEGEHGPAWWVLRWWWAVASSTPLPGGEPPPVGDAALSPRLAARLAWLEAQLCFRRGDRDGELRAFQRAARLAPLTVPDAVTEVAAAQGRGAVRRARAMLAGAWGGDTIALVLSTLAARAWFRSQYPAAATALRAALRHATGANPKLLGEIHADLGATALQQERPEAAERHLALAEQWLERAGSERATTVVRFNRSMLANDLLDWRRARQFVHSARERRGGEAGTVSALLEELELVRSDLVRGDLEAVAAALPRLEEAARGVEERVGLQQGLAAARAQLALGEGDLAGAAAACQSADEGERALILAVVEGDRGVLPPRGLPPRWGLVATAQLLAHWRQGREVAAREELARGLGNRPKEAALGFARFAIALRRRGERLPAEWSALRVRAEQVLEQAGLDGWAARLRRELGSDTLEVVRALDGVLGAGSDALAPARLQRLARALQVEGLRIAVGGEEVAAVGPVGDGELLSVGSVTVQVTGALGEVARAALLLMLRQVPLLLGSREALPGPAGSALLGSSAALAAIREEIARWAPLPAPVLLTGEPGTGKELVARELHRLSGRRGEFVAVNCAGIPATLLESELFGVVRGAFTGADRDRPGLVEAAQGGTLFLDEVGELPVELQGKLLRLLQEREVRRVGATVPRRVDVRFVAATNRDLASAIAAGTFRQDLYYRLAYALIHVPPLRERPDDIEELAVHFTAELAHSFHRPGVRLSPAAIAVLRQGQWPGNVRELESCLARAVAAARPGEVLGPDRFSDMAPPPPPSLAPWSEALTSFRRAYFSDLLAATGGNRTLAARRAGISRQTLLYHLRELGISERGGGEVH